MTVVVLALVALQAAADSVALGRLAGPITFDGMVTAEEWGQPQITVAKPGGDVLVWLCRSDSLVYLAARIPDRHFYWGDDLVISLDIGGAGGGAPGHDDFQWYLRRTLDSSVVLRGRDGQWHPPRDDPDWRFGREREGGGWAVRSTSGDSGWTVELQLDPAYFEGRGGRRPRLAVRVYDDDPQGWYAWPGRFDRRPTEVERIPDRWAVVVGAAPE
jgi:hypothetical protein